MAVSVALTEMLAVKVCVFEFTLHDLAAGPKQEQRDKKKVTTQKTLQEKVFSHSHDGSNGSGDEFNYIPQTQC